jgi:hypothetical protein
MTEATPPTITTNTTPYVFLWRKPHLRPSLTSLPCSIFHQGLGTHAFSPSRGTPHRIFAATTQLRTAAAQLRSENQTMKEEIGRIINEVVDTPIPGRAPLPEWCTAVRSHVDIRLLQSCYEELYNCHMGTSHEITSDVHAKMIKKYSLLHGSYTNLVKGHAALESELERITRQLKASVDVRDVVVDHFLPS